MFYLYSCGIDNYSAPSMTLQGKVVDATTGDNIQTRQPNGIKVRLVEVGYPTPIDFWAKADGSFQNTKLFADKYKVIVQEGNFVQATDTQLVDLSSNQTITFSETPYARLSGVSITNSGGTVTATYKVAKGSTTALTSCVLLCATTVQVHEATTGVKKSTVTSLTSYTDAQLATTTFTSTVTGLTSGTWYARVGVLSANSLARYNYSQIVTIVVP